MSSFQDLPNDIVMIIVKKFITRNYKDVINFSLTNSENYEIMTSNNHTNEDIWSFLIERDLMPGVKWNMRLTKAQIYLMNVKSKPRSTTQTIRWASLCGYTGILKEALQGHDFKDDNAESDDILFECLGRCAKSGYFDTFTLLFSALKSQLSSVYFKQNNFDEIIHHAVIEICNKGYCKLLNYLLSLKNEKGSYIIKESGLRNCLFESSDAGHLNCTKMLLKKIKKDYPEKLEKDVEYSVNLPIIYGDRKMWKLFLRFSKTPMTIFNVAVDCGSGDSEYIIKHFIKKEGYDIIKKGVKGVLFFKKNYPCIVKWCIRKYPSSREMFENTEAG